MLNKPCPGAQGPQPDIGLAVPSRGIPGTSAKDQILLSSSSWSPPRAFAAHSQLNTAAEHPEEHLPSSAHRTLCGLFFPHKYFFIFVKNLTLNKQTAYVVLLVPFFCLFSLNLISLPPFDMTINQLRPLITW